MQLEELGVEHVIVDQLTCQITQVSIYMMLMTSHIQTGGSLNRYHHHGRVPTPGKEIEPPPHNHE